MKCNTNLPGSIYPNNGRYWWKVKFPGEKTVRQIPLKPDGAKFATKDFKLAQLVASGLWQKHLRKAEAQTWDGKLTTLVKLYNQHNLDYYLPPSREAYNIALGITPLAGYYPDMMADEFTSLHLKEFQKYLIASPEYDWCRKLINERIRCIKRMFKWAASETLISIYTYTSLTTVEGLRRGRTVARESRKVLPADIEMVEAVIGFVTPVLADMIRVQMYTGMRSGELCRLRPCNIDRSGDVWIYQPESEKPAEQYSHKTAYLGLDKVIVIGPKAQKVLIKYLFRGPADYCFKPKESYRQHLQQKAANRKTPKSCGNCPGSNRKGTRKFRDCYTSDSYMKAIKRACRILYPAPKNLPEDEKKAWEKEHSWHPHQLRHSVGTDLSKQFGLEAARVVLGHKKISTTELYAELDLEKALNVAKIVG